MARLIKVIRMNLDNPTSRAEMYALRFLKVNRDTVSMEMPEDFAYGDEYQWKPSLALRLYRESLVYTVLHEFKDEPDEILVFAKKIAYWQGETPIDSNIWRDIEGMFTILGNREDLYPRFQKIYFDILEHEEKGNFAAKFAALNEIGMNKDRDAIPLLWEIYQSDSDLSSKAESQLITLSRAYPEDFVDTEFAMFL